MKQALIIYGPLVTTIILHEDYEAYTGRIYEHMWGNFTGGYHCETVIGYNDDPRFWIIKNSWRTKWGEDGWFRIAYRQNSIESYSILIKYVYGMFRITFVDDDKTGGPWYGTTEAPYMTIQDGINNSYSGYTVFVNNNLYNEIIVVNKQLSIKGEDHKNTVIDGNGIDDVISIKAEDVELSGFTIQNSGTGLYDADVIITSKYLRQDNNSSIYDNIIKENEVGVRIYTGCSNIIKNNFIQKNKQNGVQSEWALQNSIVGNTILDNKNNGIFLKGSSNESVIKNCNIIENNSFGINLEYSDKNLISGNNFIDNQKHATFIDSFLNKWRRDYWDDHVPFFSKIIQGTIGKNEYSWYNVDWHPSIQPH